MFWKQKTANEYPSAWKRMFVMRKLCVGYDHAGNEIWARFEWVQRRWHDLMTEEIKGAAAVKSITYFRPGLHPH